MIKNAKLKYIIVLIFSLGLVLPISSVMAGDIDLDGYADTGPWDCTRDDSCPDTDRDGVYDYYTVFHAGGMNGSDRTEMIYVDQCVNKPGSGLSVLPYLLDEIPEEAWGTNGCPAKCNSVHNYDFNPDNHLFFLCPQNSEDEYVCWQRWPELGWAPAGYNGIPADWDCDGVIDTEDECRRVPGPYYNQGCPRRDREQSIFAEAGLDYESIQALREQLEEPEERQPYIGDAGDWDCVGESCSEAEEDSPPKTPIPTEPEPTPESEEEAAIDETSETLADIDVPFYSSDEASESEQGTRPVLVDYSQPKQNSEAQSYSGCSLISKATRQRSALIFILSIIPALLPILVTRFNRLTKPKNLLSIILLLGFLLSASNSHALYNDIDRDTYPDGEGNWDCSVHYNEALQTSPLEDGSCPDSDEDGVIDPRDFCDEDPGDPSLYGCPDKDKDGVYDYYTRWELPGAELQGAGSEAAYDNLEGGRDAFILRKIYLDACPDEAGSGISVHPRDIEKIPTIALLYNGCPTHCNAPEFEKEHAEEGYIEIPGNDAPFYECPKNTGIVEDVFSGDYVCWQQWNQFKIEGEPLLDFNGLPHDQDCDGTPDDDDDCILEPGDFYNQGCPEEANGDDETSDNPIISDGGGWECADPTPDDDIDDCNPSALSDDDEAEEAEEAAEPSSDEEDDESPPRTPIPTETDDNDDEPEEAAQEQSTDIEDQNEQTSPQVDFYSLDEAQEDATDETSSILPESNHQAKHSYSGCSLISKGTKKRSISILLLVIFLAILPTIRYSKLNKRIN